MNIHSRSILKAIFLYSLCHVTVDAMHQRFLTTNHAVDSEHQPVDQMHQQDDDADSKSLKLFSSSNKSCYLKVSIIAGLLLLLPISYCVQQSLTDSPVELSHELISDCCHELYPRQHFLECDRTYGNRTQWKEWQSQIHQLRCDEERLQKQSPYCHPQDLTNVRSEISELETQIYYAKKAACPKKVQNECGNFFEQRESFCKDTKKEFRYLIPNRTRRYGR